MVNQSHRSGSSSYSCTWYGENVLWFSSIGQVWPPVPQDLWRAAAYSHIAPLLTGRTGLVPLVLAGFDAMAEGDGRWSAGRPASARRDDHRRPAAGDHRAGQAPRP